VLIKLRGWLPEGSSLPDEIWARRHRTILIILGLHIPGIFFFALANHVGAAHATVEAGVVAGITGWAVATRRYRRVSTVFAALGLLTASAVLVHLSGGLIEMHFHYFVVIGLVTLYQEWWPFLVAIGYIVLQHGFGSAVASSVFNHPEAIEHPWRWAGVHGLFITAMSATGIVNWRFNESLLRATAQQKHKLAEAQAVAHIGSWELDLVSGEATWSDELYRIFEVDPMEFRPSFEGLLAMVHPGDRGTVLDAVRAALAERDPYVVDYRVILADGTERWINARGAVIQSDEGQPVGMAGTAQDITDRKRSEAELSQTLSLLGATLESTADGILVVDQTGRITSYNRRFVELWRLSDGVLEAGDDEEALRSVVAQVRQPEAFLAKVQELYSQPEAESHDIVEFKDGRVFERYSKPQRVNGVAVGRVWCFRDVTEHKRLERELEHLAFHDSLTNLANQALFRDRVQHALSRATRHPGHLAVLFLDLDNFKTVNDSLGHAAGDELLVAVAERLRGSIRVPDTAARLGGDEFAVLIEDLTSPADATLMAERLIGALQQPFVVGGLEVFVGASIGIARNGAEMDTGQLLRNADIAMYTAKRLGKGRYEVFEPAMHAAAVERLELEGDLRRALDRAELTLHYQPVVALDTGRITGVEALARWPHPERGFLPPATFIPLAEETGLIRRLGRQVLSAACLQARRWQVTHQEELTVSVNVSPRQLQGDGLLDDVTEALSASGLAASSLVLEITEGAMLQDSEAVIAKLDALKALGVRLAVDDFGTGFSSLSYLQRFPVDILKIDRSFVAAIDAEEDKSSLVRAIVSLTRTMNLKSVAEGVESRRQSEILTALGCDEAQGYYLGRPMDPAALEAMLSDPTGAGSDAHAILAAASSRPSEGRH
jgi:diguanylate cyclase (GGDEF)-like protein/PAS domain S-box-containing protein